MATQQQLEVVAELEVEMMSDMYRRMTNACQDKCIAKTFKEGELTKGEAVCLDRCVAKYLDVHEKLGKRLTNMSQTDEAALQKINETSPWLGVESNQVQVTEGENRLQRDDGVFDRNNGGVLMGVDGNL